MTNMRIPSAEEVQAQHEFTEAIQRYMATSLQNVKIDTPPLESSFWHLKGRVAPYDGEGESLLPEYLLLDYDVE